MHLIASKYIRDGSLHQIIEKFHIKFPYYLVLIIDSKQNIEDLFLTQFKSI